ncbi:glycine cleavage system protein GcvH [Desulfopila inferna]|uniref:glycine cleavage system protein GcvH n=1 Tax=Desulfopila inferna TaxID=468528 RepID=UPI001963F295|nr:glycine cleavage system protein GcvH [Desulfopila inferna]MBM9603375.1 glycine cleavage system protein GcvH [Desulfopila inferna]
MKELEELKLPEDVSYTKEHEWAKIEGDVVLIGITDYAQDQLGDIVFVEMPEEGDSFSSGEEFGTLESVKAVSELYIPVSGEIVAVNEELEDTPELLNQDPYGGWIIKVKPDNMEEMDDLLDHDAYLKILEGE